MKTKNKKKIYVWNVLLNDNFRNSQNYIINENVIKTKIYNNKSFIDSFEKKIQITTYLLIICLTIPLLLSSMKYISEIYWMICLPIIYIVIMFLRTFKDTYMVKRRFRIYSFVKYDPLVDNIWFIKK